jgi:hypothetical protein
MNATAMSRGFHRCKLAKHVYVHGLSAMLAFFDALYGVHYLVEVGLPRSQFGRPRPWRRSSPILKQTLNK